MPDTHTFMIRFDGSDIRNGPVPHAVFTPALQAAAEALSVLIDACCAKPKFRDAPSPRRLSLEVRAQESGCFYIDLTLTHDFAGQLRALAFGQPKDDQPDAAGLFRLLLETLALRLRLNGRSAEEVLAPATVLRSGCLFMMLDGKPLTMSRAAKSAAGRTLFAVACAALTAPLTECGIESLTLSDTEEALVLTKTDIPALCARATVSG